MRLNLPCFDYKLNKLPDGSFQIYDRLRGKFVNLTPEEWVRQHFVNFLIEHRGFPPHLMANEVGIKHNGCQRRCDTIVYDHAAQPILIIEYKSPDIDITASVFDQIVRYNMVLQVKWLIVSNGLKHFCCQTQGTKYFFLHDIPAYSTLQ